MKSLLFLLCVVLAFSAAAADPAPPKPADVAGRQIDLCMVGDSGTWYGHGDLFRAYALEYLPNLAFVGTHSAKLGYSHAGEGGDNVIRGLKLRIDDRERIPDCRYYHLQMGGNDSAAARAEEEIPALARQIADALIERIATLLARPGAEKVFWGTILPCVPDNPRAGPVQLAKFRVRDQAGSAVNAILRQELPEKFGSKVVIVDYEKDLRPRPDWPKLIRLHPGPDGYRILAHILAEAIRENAVPANRPLEKFGVEVTNLWNEKERATAPLIPGWYTMSFTVKKLNGNLLELVLRSRDAVKYRQPFRRSFKLPAAPGQRVHFEFMTGYEGYGYNRSPLEFADLNGELADIQVEKKRPSGLPSVYGKGTFVDSASPMSLGEKFVPIR